MSIVDRLRRIAIEDNSEAIFDDAIDTLREQYNMDYKYNSRNAYASDLVKIYEYKKSQIKQYIQS